MSVEIICGPSDDDMVCPMCDGNNRGKHRMDACDLCAGEGTLGLFSGLFRALDQARVPVEGEGKS